MSKGIHAQSLRKAFQERYQENASILSSLKDCIKKRDLNKGSKIHAHILKRGFLENDIYVGSALVSLYSKCGVLAKAQEVFDQLPVHDVVSWTSLMFGYAQLGQAEVVFHLFKKMRVEGIQPDLVSFLILLTGCSHGGLLKQGEKLFDDVSTANF